MTRNEKNQLTLDSLERIVKSAKETEDRIRCLFNSTRALHADELGAKHELNRFMEVLMVMLCQLGKDAFDEARQMLNDIIVDSASSRIDIDAMFFSMRASTYVASCFACIENSASLCCNVKRHLLHGDQL